MDSIVKRAGNDALNVNYPGNFIDYSGGTAQIAITTHGSDWYWAVCAVMTASTFVFFGLSLTKPRSERIFHYITGSITLVASIAYFSMASNIGWAPIHAEFQRSDAVVAGTNREIFYVRYIDWVITTPLLLTDLLLTAGMPWPNILLVILVDEVMIITGLVGALVRSVYKFGYFTFGCVALFYVGYVLMFEARTHSKALGADIGRVFLMCGSWTFLLWCLYPIAWGVSEGGNVIAPDSEAVFYGILDIMAKPVFGALLLWGHRNIDPARLGLHIRDYDVPPANSKGSNGTSDVHEKDVEAGHTAAAAAPMTGGVTGNATATAEHSLPTTTSNYQTTTTTSAPTATYQNQSTTV